MTQRIDHRSPGQPMKRKMLIEASRDVEAFRAALIALAAAVDASHVPMPEVLAEFVTPEQFATSQRELRVAAVADARRALSAHLLDREAN